MRTYTLILAGFLAVSFLWTSQLNAEDNGSSQESEKITVTITSNDEDPFMMLAQMDSDMPPGPPGDEVSEYGKGNHRHYKRHEEKIGMFLIWRIINEVDIRDEQLDKFFPLMREHQKLERENAHELHHAKKELNKALENESTSDKDIEKLTQNVIEKQKEIWEERQSATDKMMKILDTKQKARFILAISGIEDKVRNSIARIKYDPDFDKEKFRGKMEMMREHLKKFEEYMKDRSYDDILNTDESDDQK